MLPKMRTTPIISLVVLCDYEYTITIYQQETTVQKMDNKYKKAPRTDKQEYGKFPCKQNNKNCGK